MMESKHPGLKMIYQFNLDNYIPKDPFLRLVNSAVDLSFVRDLVKRFYSDRGAPSVDPVVVFNMSLLGYFYGMSSERRLAEECRYNLAFKWFLRYDVDEMTPDHSIFSKARARFGKDAFEQFFAEVVRKCKAKGLMDRNRVFLDATLLRANASRKSIVKRGEYLELKQSPREYLDALWRENPAEEDDSPGPKGEGGDGSGDAGSRKVKTNEAVVSKTDPDASLVARRGTGPMLAHKVHIAVADGKARIVTAVTATPGAVQEHEAVERLLQKHRFITHEKPGTRRGLGLRGQEGVHPPGQARDPS
jgi:transposase